jgi:SAM-dependent methyltransferase
MIEPTSLAEANIIYRRPDLYDELMCEDGQATMVARMVAELDAPVANVLDLGCGTGRHLAAFQNRYGWSGVGVDLQERMIDYARATHPDLDLRVGDMRDLRLGARFDLITCLGNSLAYLHTDRDLAAAAATLSEHANPGALLVVSTLTSPPPATASLCRVEAVGATVTINSRWHPDIRLSVTYRQWEFDHGESVMDEIVRRVITPNELDSILVPRWERVRAFESSCAVYRATTAP